MNVDAKVDVSIVDDVMSFLKEQSEYYLHPAKVYKDEIGKFN